MEHAEVPRSLRSKNTLTNKTIFVTLCLQSLTFHTRMKHINVFIMSLKSYYSPFMKTGSIILALLVAGQSLQLAFPFLQGKIIDNLAQNSSLMDLLMIGLSMLVLYAAISVIGFVREKYEIDHFDMSLGKHVESKVLEKLFAFSLGQHVNENSGLRLSVVRKGTSALSNFASLFIYSVIPFLLQIILAAAAIALMNPLLGAAIFLIAVIYVVALFRFNIAYFSKFKENRDRWNKQDKYFSEILRNIKLVKLSAKEREMTDEFRGLFEEISIPTRELWKEYTRTQYVRAALLNVAQVGALFAGVLMVKFGVESPGKIVMYIGWTATLFGNIGNLSWIQRQLLQHFGDIDKLEHMLTQPQAVVTAKNPILLPRLSGRIEFQHVSFSYPKIASIEDTEEEKDTTDDEKEETSKEILRDVSFVIEPGKTVAIVGRSGAGKSTIVNLLLRGYDPDEGTIFIDGVDLRLLDQPHYLTAIGYVPQHVELFDNTLRYNLLFARTTHSAHEDEDLEDIAKKTRIDQFYERLGEKRFDMLIGENGIKLSGGERQRVGIARALLKEPQVLIFDEATSSLDSENESLIHDAMKEALEGRTGIIIAHRLSTVRDADMIIVMDSGAIAGTGTHDELMETSEVYQRLIAHQRVA